MAYQTVDGNGNSQLQTTATYANSWAATSLTGPNGAQGTTTYDSYGRPAQTSIPDGAVTTYTYTYNPTTQTATAYEEHATSGAVLLHKDLTWTTDNSGGEIPGAPT